MNIAQAPRRAERGNPLLCPHVRRDLLTSLIVEKAIDPPPELSLRNAVQLLQSLGALDDGEELTDLGARLAGISIDPRCALARVCAAAVA